MNPKPFPEPLPEARERIAGLFQASHRPLLTGHVLADGDVLGSAVALWHGLRSLGKEPRIVLNEPIAPPFAFLEPAEGVVVVRDPGEAEREVAAADLAVVVDNNAWSRLGLLEAPLGEAVVPVVCIDHHPAEAPFSEHHLLDDRAAAAGIVVFDLLRELRIDLTAPMAEAIYTAIVNDTGRFRHGNTDARSFEVALELVRAGASPERVARELEGRDRLEAKRLLARFLETIQLHRAGTVAIGLVTRRMLQATGGRADETENFVSHLRRIENVVVSAFFREDADEVKLSLRGAEGSSVRPVALRFGGGGHEAAAGATLPLPLDRAIEQVLAAIDENLAAG